MSKQTTLLCILDGWGHSENDAHNAIAYANTPNWDKILKSYPNSLLNTSGLDVGLPEGQMGNSEVGHMNIGSGRIILQLLPRINKEIAENKLKENDELKIFIKELQEAKGTCHLLGILSDGGVHGHDQHLIEIAKIIASHNINVNIHAITDGRDTPPQSALQYIDALETAIKPYPQITLTSISGRYYAMDRDSNWDRVEIAYKNITEAVGNKTTSFSKAISDSYEQKINDEFIIPTSLKNYSGMKNGDGFLFTNFRADRAREITEAFLDLEFNHFSRKKISFSASLSMAEYSVKISKYLPCMFPVKLPKNTLSDVLEKENMTQLHIAETEKYAHVTFFFNGGIEKPKKGEDRILIPSPNVATYDLQPEMSAPQVTEKLVEAINSNKYDFIVVNFANGDMVGHTGDWNAALKAVTHIDHTLKLLEETVLKNNANMLITADHGNIEQMHDSKNNQPSTSHTVNAVPFVIISKETNITLNNGKLCDIAPTILEIMQISQPKEMTGKSLFLSQ